LLLFEITSRYDQLSSRYIKCHGLTVDDKHLKKIDHINCVQDEEVDLDLETKRLRIVEQIVIRTLTKDDFCYNKTVLP